MSNEKRKWTSAQVVSHIKKIQNIVKRQKAKSKKKNFVAVSNDDLESKFARVNSPMIMWQSWSGATIPGGSINYNVGIYNPDPTAVGSVFAHVWIGSGNVVANTGDFLNNVDPRFPRLTEPSFPGQSIAANGGSVTLSFTLDIPASAERSNYMGNACLMQANWSDVGTYYDRGFFIFEVQ